MAAIGSGPSRAGALGSDVSVHRDGNRAIARCKALIRLNLFPSIALGARTLSLRWSGTFRFGRGA